jgi:hypothetical protein
MAGSDIKSGHLHGSGFIFNRARVRALDIVGTSPEGTLEIPGTQTRRPLRAPTVALGTR